MTETIADHEVSHSLHIQIPTATDSSHTPQMFSSRRKRDSLSHAAAGLEISGSVVRKLCGIMDAQTGPTSQLTHQYSDGSQTPIYSVGQLFSATFERAATEFQS